MHTKQQTDKVMLKFYNDDLHFFFLPKKVPFYTFFLGLLTWLGGKISNIEFIQNISEKKKYK